MEVIAIIVAVGLVIAVIAALGSTTKAVPDPVNSQKVERDAREATAFWLDLKEVLPYLATPRIPNPTQESIYAAIAKLVYAPPSIGKAVGFGTGGFGRDVDFSVPALPEHERRRHLYIVGKTGSGKSTFLEHLVAHDLAKGRGVGVISPEGDFFRERLLPLVPTERKEDLIYFAPGDPKCPITLKPAQRRTRRGCHARGRGSLYDLPKGAWRGRTWRAHAANPPQRVCGACRPARGNALGSETSS